MRVDFSSPQSVMAGLAAKDAEIERLQALLNGRDTFIVDCGLWSDFLATLPRDNEQTALEKLVDGITPENRHPETRT